MKIGLLGFGVVGQGVYELTTTLDDFTVTKVLCRAKREIPGVKVVTSVEDILSDPEIDLVVECIGGIDPAYTYIKGALLAGKHVVTSNKAVMAAHYDELVNLSQRQGVGLRCTAAVGGGLCWLSELERAKRCQRVLEVGGIMNGTCNYILDNMTRYGMDYAQALSQAQELGYAERDPAADVEGFDTFNKVILSANVAFDISLEKTCVPVAGISRISAGDVVRFHSMGRVCKLVGRAGADFAWVQPVLYPDNAPEAAVPLNFNRISFVGSATGESALFGQGAGRYPTAYNVVQDLADIRRGRGFYAPAGPKTAVHNRLEMCYYVRGDWDGPIREDLCGAVITQPIAVADMHAWLREHPGAFIAALA